MIKDPMTVALIQSTRDPHWTYPALQREFEEFFLTLTRGRGGHESVAPRVLRINNKNVAFMGEFYVALRGFEDLDICTAVTDWVSRKKDRKVRIEFQGFEVVGETFCELSSFLSKLSRKN